MTVSAPYSQLVAEHGLGGSHRLILAEVRDGARVLDVGCATGYLAAELSARRCEVVGIEPDPDSAAQAERSCERVVVGSFESAEDRAQIPGTFDFVIFGDVLEHLVDPWEALRASRALLSAGGAVVVSLPNVAAWPVRLGLLAGHFEYANVGLLDRTHLRFFTRRTPVSWRAARDSRSSASDSRTSSEPRGRSGGRCPSPCPSWTGRLPACSPGSSRSSS